MPVTGIHDPQARSAEPHDARIGSSSFDFIVHRISRMSHFVLAAHGRPSLFCYAHAALSLFGDISSPYERHGLYWTHQVGSYHVILSLRSAESSLGRI
jgi:hypothetical protein